MFYECISLSSMPDISKINLSNINKLKDIFSSSLLLSNSSIIQKTLNLDKECINCINKIYKNY